MLCSSVKFFGYSSYRYGFRCWRRSLVRPETGVRALPPPAPSHREASGTESLGEASGMLPWRLVRSKS